VRRSVQIDSTAVIFRCGSNILRGRWVVFIFYFLSCVIHKFFFTAGLGTVHQHLHLAFFRPDHYRLAAHAPNHVKRVHRTAPKCKLQHVFLHPFFQCLFQIVGDLKKSVGRAQPADTLVGPLVIIVLDPQGGPLHGLFEAVKLGALQKLVQYRLPEPLDFAKRHGMMGTGADVLDTVFFHLPLEPGLAPPVRILPAVVGKHLPGHAVFGNCAPVGLQNMFGRLTAIQSQAADVPAVVVHKADQVRVATRQSESHDVALPQLVGTGSFEKPRLGWISRRFALGLFHKPLLGQGLVDGGLAGGDQKKPLEHVGDPARPVLRMNLLEVNHPLPNFLRYLSLTAGVSLRFQTLGSTQSVGPYPALDRMAADPELLTKQGAAVALLQKKSNHPQPELDGIGQGPAGSLGPACNAFLFLFHGLHSSLCNWFLH